MLHGSQDYKFVVTEEFGIVSSYAPRTVFGDVQTMVVVSSKDTINIYFREFANNVNLPEIVSNLN